MSDIRLESPHLQDDGAVWLKGNLHCHTTVSDGKASPQETIRRYAELGHDFLMISDHDALTDVSGLDACGMVLLPGCEVSANGPHLLDVGARLAVPYDTGRQEIVDRILRESGFPVLCHPNWEEAFDHYTFKTLQALHGYAGVEIFNGAVIDMPGSHLAIEKWDRLLATGRRVWGYATDDTHRLEGAGRGWCVVRVRERSAAAILAALRDGNFYASCGVTIDSIRCEGSRLIVSAPNADRIAVIGLHGRRLHHVDGRELDFDTAAVAGPHIRVECYGQADQAAWTQPIVIRDGVYEQGQRRRAALEMTAASELRVLRAARAPALTGLMDDPLWRDAPRHTNFVGMRDGLPAPVGTELRCIFADGTLYLAVKCEEPLLEQLRQKGGSLNTLWKDDSVEFFMDAEGRGESHCQTIVNAAGVVSSGWYNAARHDLPVVSAKSGRWSNGGARGWCVELAIPAGQLAAQPAQSWGFHLCRNRTPVRGSYVWSWVGESNHATELYGKLLFQ